LDPGPAVSGNAYARDDLRPLPTGLGEALELLRGSELARRALGEEGHAAFSATIAERTR
jgi:glutamine synthetase